MTETGKKVALITGITGQDGSYLAEFLLSKDYQVNGIIRRSSSFNTARIEHIYQDPHEKDYRFRLWYGDLSDSGVLLKLLSQIQPDEVYNLGAQSVAEQCLCPILSAQNLEYRTLGDLWYEQVKKKKQISREKVGSVGVEVINLGKNTQLKALGMWNGMGTWFRIKQISRHWWKGKIVKLSQKFGSVMVTPNHSILDVNGKICTPKENPWLLSIRKLNYKPNKYRHNIRLKLDGVYKSDKTHFWLDEKGVQSKVLKVVVDDKLMAFCRFIGAFIAEGHTTFNKANGNWYVGISSGNKQWLKELEIDLKVFYKGKCWYIRHKKGNLKDVWELQIKSRTLYSLFRKLLGENSKTKQLPYWFSQIEKKYLLEIWNKMLEGDGCIDNKRGFRYTTISYKLACQLGWLLTTIGYDYTVHEETNNGSNNVWHFRECTSYQPNQGSNERKIEWMDYDGWVYDITVDEVHNFSVGVGNIVVHNSHVKVSFEIPEYTADIDAIGTLRLLEAIRYLKTNCKFYQGSSSEMFGTTPPPQNENTPFHPRSPYAAAKVFAHHTTVNYREAYGIFACSGILFNHESPRRGETFVTRKITHALAKILNKKQEKIYLGNLDAQRDWGYAPEFVEAMWTMLQQPQPDDYVLATGEIHSVREFLEEAFRLVSLNWKDYVETDPRYLRPTEVDQLRGDASKAKAKFGWQPKVMFKDLVRLMVIEDLKLAGLDPQEYGLETRHSLTASFLKDLP